MTTTLPWPRSGSGRGRNPDRGSTSPRCWPVSTDSRGRCRRRHPETATTPSANSEASPASSRRSAVSTWAGASHGSARTGRSSTTPIACASTGSWRPAGATDESSRGCSMTGWRRVRGGRGIVCPLLVAKRTQTSRARRRRWGARERAPSSRPAGAVGTPRGPSSAPSSVGPASRRSPALPKERPDLWPVTDELRRPTPSAQAPRMLAVRTPSARLPLAMSMLRLGPGHVNSVYEIQSLSAAISQICTGRAVISTT